MTDLVLLAEALVRMVKAVPARLGWEELAGLLSEQAVAVLGIDDAGVWLRGSEDADALLRGTGAAVEELLGVEADERQGPSVEVMRDGRPVIVDDIVVDRRWPGYAAAAINLGFRSVAAVVMQVDGDRVGALEFYGREPHAFDEDDLRAVQTLADVVAAYLAPARQIQELQRQAALLSRHALYDPLTGAANRVLLHDRLQRAIRRAGREQTLVGVLFVDADGLKDVNDQMGHRAGDDLLTSIAGLLQSRVRPQDTVARVGGDEFVVVLNGLNHPAEAAVVADRVLGSVPRVERGDMVVSISIGVAVGSGDASIGEDLIAAADRAMYEAKRAGGNRSHVAGSPSGGGHGE